MPRPARLIALLASLSCADPVGPNSFQHAFPLVENSVIPLPALAELAPGQRLIVSLHSTGCFHDYEADLSFLAAEGGHLVTVRARSRYSLVTGRSEARSLTPVELHDLDRQLERLREPGGQGLCTTHTRYTLTLLQDGIAIGRELLNDEDCRTFRLFFNRPQSKHPSITLEGLAADALQDQ